MLPDDSGTVAAENDGSATPSVPPPTPLRAPRDGVPEVIDSERRLVSAAAALATGSGPLAIDAERASGYRYGQRAYLVQIRREGAGTHLVDPAACPDLSPIQDAVGDVEWVLHAATQDLPCLAEVGLHPRALFDTELGARIAGQPRVGLAAVVEHYLGLTLAKEHSAVDWSTRPLPREWLTYAALDVEVLVALRDEVAKDLRAQGKLEWALEEFDALTGFTGPPARSEPWRRTAGIHKVRGRRSLAVLRELWQTRDDIARHRDVAPGRVLADSILVQLATTPPSDPSQLGKLTTHRSVRRYERDLFDAVRRGLALAEDDLPVLHVPAEGPPPPRSWADRDPLAAARLNMVKAAMTALSESHTIPLENLLTPDTLRRVMWSPPEPTLTAVSQALAARGARAWQIDLAAPHIVAALLHAVVPAESESLNGDAPQGRPSA